MGKKVGETIRDFSLGMTTESRETDTRYSQLLKNFDSQSYKNKLVPFRSSESGDSAASLSKKAAFSIALRSGTTYKLFGLGVVTGSGKAEIAMKGLTNTNNDLSDDGWDTPSNNASASGSTSFNLFVYYKKAGLIYGAKSGTNIWAFDPSSSTAFDETARSITYTNIAQGLVHTDDVMYIPYDNKIASYDGSTWTDAALTIKSDIKINSICSYGKYIAIAASPLSGFGNSSVYLWDTDATSWSEVIDFGEGDLRILEELEGQLIGISYPGSSTASFNQKVVFRSYDGGEPTVFKELVNESTFSSQDQPIDKQKVNDSLYFLMGITLNGVDQEGLWRIKRARPGLPLSVTFDTTPNNDTALTSGTLNSFIVIGDFKFISYIDSATYGLSKTDNTNKHDITATYETVILNDGDASFTKKLNSATVMFEKLPANGQVTLKYKKDGETSFTTIFTHTTVDTLRHTARNIESSGIALPEYKEITFRIESTGEASTTGDTAVITGFKYESEIKDDDI